MEEERVKMMIENSIEQGKVINGMNTLEASLAGGAYFFRVIADPDVYEDGIDPNIVIKAQVEKPDNSKIWMTFKNTTQYNEKEIQTFQIAFEHGKVIAIKNITEANR